MHESRTRPGGRVVWVYDATLDDSDKTFTVPVGKMWLLKEAYHEGLASAVVGVRNYAIVVSNGVNNIFRTPTLQYSANQTGAQLASTTFDNHSAAIPTVNLAGVAIITGQTTFLPEMLLPAGYTVRMYDFTAIDAAGDHMFCVLHYIEYDA